MGLMFVCDWCPRSEPVSAVCASELERTCSVCLSDGCNECMPDGICRSCQDDGGLPYEMSDEEYKEFEEDCE